MFPADDEPGFYLPRLTEADCRDLMAGRVPEDIREACRSVIDWTVETGPLSYAGQAVRAAHRQAKGKLTCRRH